ncbi:hypothetical protein D3C75_762230 [compost metagenome]
MGSKASQEPENNPFACIRLDGALHAPGGLMEVRLKLSCNRIEPDFLGITRQIEDPADIGAFPLEGLQLQLHLEIQLGQNGIYRQGYRQTGRNKQQSSTVQHQEEGSCRGDGSASPA